MEKGGVSGKTRESCLKCWNYYALSSVRGINMTIMRSGRVRYFLMC